MIFVFLGIIGVFTLTFCVVFFEYSIKKPPHQNKFSEEVLFVRSRNAIPCYSTES